MPLETDVLNTNKNAMFALGQFAQDVFGTSTIFNGLACVPNTPAAMNVIVQPGVVYAQAALDATAYSSLAADSTVTMKQGILKAAQTFATPAPVTSGQSIVYLISGAFLEADTGATVLPYYNASNPAQAYSGPNNLGTSQNTLRQDTVQLTLTAGVPATTGSQTTPATPVGQTALYTVTVAYGASTVVAGNIAKVAGAPFLTSNLLSLIQSVPTSGRLIGVQVFPGSGTYAPTSGMSTVVFEVQGGGGAGGGASGATSTNVTLGGPGVSGTYAKARYSAAQVGASQVITVGAGGTAVNGAAGGSGGSSSVGSLIVAPGGPGGTMLTNTAAPTVNSTGANSGAATGANIFSSLGSAASPSIAISSAVAASGAGGPSIFGPGGYSTGINSVGANAQNRGAGGGAAISNSSGGSLFGGNGGSGIVIAWEYA